MKRILVFVVLALAANLTCAARAIVDGNLQVKPLKNNQFQVDNYRFGKVEFYGFVGDQVETKKITGLVLLDGEKASDEQKHVISSTAKTQKIDAFIMLDGKQQVLVDDRQVAPPPPLDAQTPAAAAPASH